MPVAAIVVLSIFAGAFLLIIVAGLAALIVLHFRTQKALRETQESFSQFGQSLEAAITEYQQNSVALIDGARASFTGIRQDVKTSQDAQAKLLDKSLKDHDKSFRDTMGRINPAAMEASSVRLLQATGKIVQVANTLQVLLASHEVPEAADLGPEEYAPSDTIYAMQGFTAKADAAAERSDAEDSAPLFSGAQG